MKFSLFAIFFVTFYIFQLAKVGSTEQCRSLSLVHASTMSIANNIKYGGHIWQHIYNLYRTPSGADSGDTQSRKTLFVSDNDFQKAWNSWRNERFPASTPHNCDSYASRNTTYADCVDAASIGIYKAIECVSDYNRICVQGTSFSPKYVKFVYKKGYHSWFLRTAFPLSLNKYCY